MTIPTDADASARGTVVPEGQPARGAVAVSPGRARREGVGGRLRRLVRNVTVGSLSLVVIGSLALYLAAPQGSALAMSMTTTSVPGTATVVYGRVTTSHGSPLPGVRVELRAAHQGDRDGGRELSHDQVTSTGADGTYRMALRPGRYTVTMSGRFHGREIRASIRLDARAGRTYDLSARVRSDRFVFFPPLFTY